MSAPRRILVTGGTGFIGSAVLRALVAGREPAHVVALVRQFPEPDARVWAAGVEYCAGDLTEERSLRGLCEGVDTLLHCASYIGPDAEANTRVNELGTHALLAEAARASVRRILYVSTTAVYGSGPHRGLAEDTRPPAPASPTSGSRLLAERAVLAAGGTVLRPPFVHGAGDKWVVPAVAELLHRVTALPDEGRALLSLVAVEDLARLIARLALSPEPLPPGAHHAAHPVPVPLRELVARLVDLLGLPAPVESLPTEAYLERLRATPGRVAERQARMLSEDRWYRSALWERVGCPVGPGLDRLAEHADWYRELLAPARAQDTARP
ncbi:NAD-dependent epimerase/dehydratase family protein [Streptomyces sp. NA04227]|uniref:NAD-dependent epimerase/dehydratase family protein n=1 Tax=Streptomyces sp. NA04227 TaxID=2742136 RepID=UPI001591B825|nr:NAD-dependent epimerase/dehydratase family protein [Streptomyces sp. NA04227]QKW08436.1 NAD-dependent epimerase/dehydratase family protein [Streptomyces sp. NA04227]